MRMTALFLGSFALLIGASASSVLAGQPYTPGGHGTLHAYDVHNIAEGLNWGSTQGQNIYGTGREQNGHWLDTGEPKAKYYKSLNGADPNPLADQGGGNDP